MGSSNDNSGEELFWGLLRTAWLLIVLCVSAVLFIYRLLAKQKEKSPSTVTVSAAVTPEKTKPSASLTGSRTPLILTVTVATGVTLLVASFATNNAVLFLLSMMAFGTGAFLALDAKSPAPTDIIIAADTESIETTLALPKPVMRVQGYTIRMARETEWNREQALHFIEQMVATFPHLILRLVADHQSISWQLVDTANFSPGVVEPILRSCYPTAEIIASPLAAEVVNEPFFRVVCSFEQVNEFVAPLMYVTDIKQGSNHYDPLSAFAQAMNALNPGERIILSLGILGFAQRAHQRGEKMITQSTIHPLQWATWAGIQDALAKKAYNLDRVDKYVSEDQRVLNEKLRQKLYHCILLLQIDAAEAKRTAELMAQTMTEFTHFSWIPYNALDWYETEIEQCVTYVQDEQQAYAAHSLTQIQQIIEAQNNGRSYHSLPQDRQYPLLILEPREMAMLWHVPHSEFTASRIAWSRGLVSLSDRIRRTSDGIRLGSGVVDGMPVPILLPYTDRVTHLNVIGRTGTGKSTFLHHLIHQDIERGLGVAVIDPHGNLIRDILRVSIPAEREPDVVLIDLANREYPPPLNPLRSARTYAATARVMSVIERLFEGFEGAPRMVNYLRSALLLLQADPEATLRDITRVFMDDVYREDLLGKADNPELEDFWDMQYHNSSPQMRSQIADPVLSRVRPFFANPYLYPMLCHPNALDMGTMLDQNQIILISLDVNEETLHGQERDLLGALLVTQLQIAAMRQRRSTPFFVYIDEVQRFVTTSLNEVLSEARKYGVALTTANQYLGQLTGKTLEAVMGNVGTTIVFACSPEDSQALSHYMKPEFTPSKLVNFDRFTAAVKMQVEAQTQPAFSLLTDEPLTYPDDWQEREQRIRTASQARHTPKRQDEVFTWLKARYPHRPTSRDPQATSEQDSFYE